MELRKEENLQEFEAIMQPRPVRTCSIVYNNETIIENKIDSYNYCKWSYWKYERPHRKCGYSH